MLRSNEDEDEDEKAGRRRSGRVMHWLRALGMEMGWADTMAAIAIADDPVDLWQYR